MKLRDRVAIVTGARRGIGEAISLTFAKEGANIVPLDVNKQDTDDLCARIRAIGSKCLSLKCDITSAEEVEEMAQETLKNFGRIDILVNNAAIDPPASTFWDLEEEVWDRTLAINLKGVYLCSKAAARHMVQQRSGKILSIASGAAVHGGVARFVAAYVAAKGGVIALTKAMALELAPFGVNVNSISPGNIETPMTQFIYSDDERRVEVVRNIPWGRQGFPQDIADAALFLASPDSRYVTGVNLLVDGGLTLPPWSLGSHIKITGHKPY